MKILALSDQVVEHLYSPLVKERFGDVDLVVGCGDLPDYYLDYIVSMLNVPLTLVPGNHDLPTPSPDAEGEGEGGGTPRACGNIDGRFLDILVTHAPPRGIHDAEDPAHVGFEAFNRFIARYRPRYLLHGHAHVYRHDAITITQVGPTTVINVYPYRVIDIEGRHAG
ncbi:MAG: metallophosphoesterase family protein [candidate division NC10 bacterium]|nr:metallophosphoesterase family protein [candidate division NC10 bacterium]